MLKLIPINILILKKKKQTNKQTNLRGIAHLSEYIDPSLTSILHRPAPYY